MDIQTYRDVTFPFDTAFANDHGKVRLLAAVVNDYATLIIGYSYYGDDPETSCSQVLDWDENGVFAGGEHPSMNLVPPPGQIEGKRAALSAEIGEIRQRLDENPDAPKAWRSRDEHRLAELERSLVNVEARHIWGREA